MNTSSIPFRGFLHAVGVMIYVVIVTQIMTHAEQFFGKMQSFWGPVAFLMLFVLSATITGLLVFGCPVYLFLDGKKQEAVKLLGFTVVWLFVVMIIVFLLAIML